MAMQPSQLQVGEGRSTKLILLPKAKKFSWTPLSHPTKAIDEQHADHESDVEQQMEADPTTEGVGDP